MAVEQIILVFLGALAGGLVNGLTGFGTGLTAMGLWLNAISPAVAATLVVICSVVAQIQTFPMIWHSIEWRRLWPFILPGLLGVPIGTWLLRLIDAETFKLGIGMFLIAYSLYILLRREHAGSDAGGRAGDALIGFGGGVLGGLAGLSGVLNIIWTDVRGWSKERRRSIIQGFNMTILLVALASHGANGLLTIEVGYATAAALPGTIAGAWAGARVYRSLGDRGYQQVVLVLLMIAGLFLIGRNLGPVDI